MNLFLILSALLAGFLMFFAPCTLPTVPGFLGFISGSSKKNSLKNALFYVFGFMLIFILLGGIFGIGGAALRQYRLILQKIGGLFIIFFGLMTTGFLRHPIFQWSFNIPLSKHLKPGKPVSSFLFGAAYGLGWTPCIGPVLGSILLLASSFENATQGIILLIIFSLGLAIPYLLVASGFSSIVDNAKKFRPVFRGIEIIGGILMIIIGILLVTNKFGLMVSTTFRLFDFINYDSLLKYL
ncbi:cytochrome c biogenesis protein CcdA [Candidatus Collierbacteria bacterium]|nr:cytochrome c biogenesis protein CcdA [Candidatus Collierbacteria bacterium]